MLIGRAPSWFFIQGFVAELSAELKFINMIFTVMGFIKMIIVFGH